MRDGAVQVDLFVSMLKCGGEVGKRESEMELYDAFQGDQYCQIWTGDKGRKVSGSLNHMYRDDYNALWTNQTSNRRQTLNIQ